MGPETSIVRSTKHKKNRKRVLQCKLKGPFPGKASIHKIMAIVSDKTSSLTELSVRYNINPRNIAEIKRGKFSHCAKRNRIDAHALKLFGVL